MLNLSNLPLDFRYNKEKSLHFCYKIFISYIVIKALLVREINIVWKCPRPSNYLKQWNAFFAASCGNESSEHCRKNTQLATDFQSKLHRRNSTFFHIWKFHSAQLGLYVHHNVIIRDSSLTSFCGVRAISALDNPIE